MAMLRDVMGALDELFPWALAQPGDNSGLQVGSLGAPVKRVLCSVDVSRDAIDEAGRRGCELLVSHHPLLFKPVFPSVDFASLSGFLIRRSVEAGLSVISSHTCADAAPGGTADLMAGRLGLATEGALEPSAGAEMAKVVVFVPPEAVDPVADAMAEAGAGTIGDYSRCSFRSPGTGTFLPGPRAHPHSGKKGELKEVPEVRLEMAAPLFALERITSAVRTVHPYEEPALDIYPLETHAPFGIGRVGGLEPARAVVDIMEDLADWCGSGNHSLSGDPGRKVERVAVVPGSGGSIVAAAARRGAELLVTGEIGYHAELEAEHFGLSVVCLGHRESERAIVPRMAEGLSAVAAREGMDLEVTGYRGRDGLWA